MLELVLELVLGPRLGPRLELVLGQVLGQVLCWRVLTSASPYLHRVLEELSGIRGRSSGLYSRIALGNDDGR